MSKNAVKCILCGCQLPEDDLRDQRGACYDCRSLKGKVADLDVAIRSTEDNPERIREWPLIRHWLRGRFGQQFQEAELWGRCVDWLKAEKEMSDAEILRMRTTDLLRLMSEDSSKAEAEALQTQSLTKAVKKRGRKKADYETVNREDAIYREWQRAREAGVYKGEFAQSKGISLKQLELILNRVSKRNSRADK